MSKFDTKYIFFTGGVSSSLGKGVTASVLASLLIARGYRVRLRKFDPYINIDAGTISPLQHGEVYVTDDGSETDLDLGHYERLSGQMASGEDNFTTGRIYMDLIYSERCGDFLGQTVQIVPHVTDAIQNIILNYDEYEADFFIIEVGGTVGDIEGLPYIEAIRQLRYRLGLHRTMFMHMTWVPYLAVAGEYKTKPTQHGVMELLRLGIKPDILICRCDGMLRQADIDKISILCCIDPKGVVVAHDVPSIYNIPKVLHSQKLDAQVLNYFDLPPVGNDHEGAQRDRGSQGAEPGGTASEHKSSPRGEERHGRCHMGRRSCHGSRRLGAADEAAGDESALQLVQTCEDYANKLRNGKTKVRVAAVGKYTTLPDAYISITEALQHAAVAMDSGVDILWIDSTELETMSRDGFREIFDGVDALLVPGGYGVRGHLGKVMALQYARCHDIPTLGICLGMQLMAIEMCRNVLNLKDATSTEFDARAKHPAVITLDKWRVTHRNNRRVQGERFHRNFLGGTMRLGSYRCDIRPNTLAAKAYNVDHIYERHRHRYEVNDRYLKQLEDLGALVISGANHDIDLPEIIEVPKCMYFIGCQYHPEFKSNFKNPHPLFLNLIKYAMVRRSGRGAQ